MAEILGTAASVISIASFFNNCVDCFEYIQLGRHFGRDYQVCQLRLDIAKTRLSRWGQAAGINEQARFTTAELAPGDTEAELARSTLEEIALLIQSAQRTAKRYELRADPKDLDAFEEKDLNPVNRRLHDRLRTLARRRRQKSAGSISLAKKTAWALYDGKQFEKLLDRTLELLDELEKILPAADACRELAELEVAEVAEDEESLGALKAAADDTDEVLLQAIAHKLDRAGGGNLNYAKEVTVGDSADVQVGHQYSEAIFTLGAIIPGGVTNAVDVVVAKGSSRVQIGSRFGGR
jgi:hypothetical protein